MPPSLILAARVLGIPALSGINLYLTVFALGLIKKLTGAEVLGPEFAIFASWPVLIVAGVFSVIEIVADKVPAVDHVWDAVHTFIRTPGAMIVVAIVTQDQGPMWQLLAVLVGGAVSFAVHASKATFRVSSTKATATVANAGISLVEDVAVGVGAWLAAFRPEILAGIVVVALALVAIFGPKVVRSLFISCLIGSRYIAYLYARVRRWFQKQWEPTPRPVELPDPALDLTFKETPMATARVIVGKFGRRRPGYLMMWKDRLSLAVRRAFRWKIDTFYFAELDDVFFAEYATLGQLEFVVRGKQYIISFLKALRPGAEAAAYIIAQGRKKP